MLIGHLHAWGRRGPYATTSGSRVGGLGATSTIVSTMDAELLDDTSAQARYPPDGGRLGVHRRPEPLRLVLHAIVIDSFWISILTATLLETAPRRAQGRRARRRRLLPSTGRARSTRCSGSTKGLVTEPQRRSRALLRRRDRQAESPVSGAFCDRGAEDRTGAPSPPGGESEPRLVPDRANPYEQGDCWSYLESPGSKEATGIDPWRGCLWWMPSGFFRLWPPETTKSPIGRPSVRRACYCVTARLSNALASTCSGVRLYRCPVEVDLESTRRAVVGSDKQMRMM